jgi:hypothetical protein
MKILSSIFSTAKASKLNSQTQRHAGELANKVAYLLENSVTEIPVIIVSYNNSEYVQNMALQLSRYQIRPIVIDNNSTNPTSIVTLEMLARDKHISLARSKHNFGPMVGFLPEIYSKLPEEFAYTDPDLKFHNSLPDDFLVALANISKQFCTFKAGMALTLEPKHLLANSTRTVRRETPIKYQSLVGIEDWENQFWRMRIEHPMFQLYSADIDTTFAVYRKSNFKGDFYDAIRVAGEFSAIHLPWFPTMDICSENSREAYYKNNEVSTWVPHNVTKGRLTE